MRKRKQKPGEGEQESSRSNRSRSTAETQKTKRSDRKTRSAGGKRVRGPSHGYDSDEIPDDIHQRNILSRSRSTVSAYHDGPAGDTGVPESVRRVLSSAGQSLDADVQRAMEDRMGDSFGDVQIHTGSRAAAACDDINARAFTVGSHIAFNSGEYDPESAEGQHVLAHELAHVRQQTGGAVSMLPQDDVELEIDPDPALEREAEETAQRVMAGGELGIQRLEETEVHVQRMAEWGEHPLAKEDADETDVSLFELAKKMGGGAGGAAIVSGLTEIAKSGGVEQALQNPESMVVVAGVTVPATALVTGWRNLVNQLDVAVIRRAFEAAGKEDLYDRIRAHLGLGAETGTGEQKHH